MIEGLGLVLMLVCAVSLAPLVWEVCDRRAAVSRLAPVPARPPARNVDATTHGATDLVTFLSSVTRALRSGSSAAQAILAAPPTCSAMAHVQDRLRNGHPTVPALDGPHPHVQLLRACMHGDILSVAALEVALADERFRVRADLDIAVAVAQARRSARVLTVLPFVFLAGVFTLSEPVRGHVVSPSLGGALAAGTVLNITGRRWIARLVRNAARPDPRLAVASAIAATCAVHLSAGGTVTGCFETLAATDARCAETASLLRAGHLLSESLRPIDDLAPQVSRTLLDAHRDGLPVTGVMTRLADDLRRASAAHIQSRIAEVSVRSTTPLVLCVLPSFLLIAVVPIALTTLSGLSMTTP